MDRASTEPALTNADRPLKILYAADLNRENTAQHRLWALERLGHTVIPFNALLYKPANPLIAKITFRVAAGPHVVRFNRDLLQAAEAERPDVVWTDKMLSLWPSTLGRLRRLGIVTVNYMIDNPFGPRRDPGWRLYMKNIPHFDLQVVQRDKNIEHYRDRGARNVIKIQTAYEPTLHFPPPPGWSDADRDRDVSFIGTPYDNRAQFLTRLSKECGFSVAVSGGLVWKRALGSDAASALYKGHGEIYSQEYRETIWRSKINLSFITHSNQDEFVHKSFEIAGCGGFLLAERSDGHMQRFEEGVEAVFFSTFEDCAEKIRRYLPDQAARTRIAAAGRARAERDGYFNDRQVGLVIERARSLIPAVRQAAGAAA
jgi:spore maturation protein CgeB